MKTGFDSTSAREDFLRIDRSISAHRAYNLVFNEGDPPVSDYRNRVGLSHYLGHEIVKELIDRCILVPTSVHMDTLMFDKEKLKAWYAAEMLIAGRDA